MKKGDLTVRQYEALSLISTKYNLEGTYPTIDEIRGVVEMKTERSINICLEALARKGFIKYSRNNGNYKIQLIDSLKKKDNEFIDKLLVTKKKIRFEKLYNSSKKIPGKDYIISRTLSGQMELFQDDYTSLERLNEKGIVHKWYRYLEDFPNHLIWDKIKLYKIKKGDTVLDPFAGSGTTMVTSKMMGIDSVGIEANPLMCKVCKAKSDWVIDLKLLKQYMNKLLNEFQFYFPKLEDKILETDCFKNVTTMELKQWLKPAVQNQVALAKELIQRIKNKKIKNLLMVAMSKAMFDASNVALCPGTSFYPMRKKPSFFEAIKTKFHQIYWDLTEVQGHNSYGKVKVINENCLNASKFIDKNSISFIITSPPYPNDLEYTRQTRLEMYLLDVVENMEQVQTIKKTMVKGSTKLIYKEDSSCEHVKKFKSIQKVANKIDKKLQGKDWGWDYPRMIREYFGNMYLCLKEYKKILKKNRYCLLIPAWIV